MTAKVDLTGELLEISPDGLAKLDDITVFRVVVRDDVQYLQFFDKDRMRSKCRGSQYVEIPLSVLQDAIISYANPEGNDTE